ncbi:hypothetical protein HDC92_002228 [Pedobacter sp. AK017]|uniref:hypothetical protein n=1 Tax=Pedobacter sp. AK017 TaxID=2723073 RepID=UPI0016102149|nr:hypothetical protein [Pedobacter sp. AK017]MBB5438552.1 hypothetical protein [Pedobacter sp. AK017]
MEKSTKPSAHILIKAETNSHWDLVDFAIIAVTKQFLNTLHQRFMAIANFKADRSFHNLTYWDAPLGYYKNVDNELFTEALVNPAEDWAYVSLRSNELENFAVPDNQLEAHQLTITNHGYANFKAYSKYTNEEYWTESFSISKLLSNFGFPVLDSS